MLEYENRLGKVYHFRAKKTKLGKTAYVASTKSSPDDIERIPRGYEIYENADGQVFCRKKLVTNILPSEVACLKAWKRKLEEKCQARVFIDVKKDEVIVHSCQHPRVAEARLGALFGFPMMRSGTGRESELFVHYQSNLATLLRKAACGRQIWLPHREACSVASIRLRAVFAGLQTRRGTHTIPGAQHCKLRAAFARVANSRVDRLQCSAPGTELWYNVRRREEIDDASSHGADWKDEPSRAKSHCPADS